MMKPLESLELGGGRVDGTSVNDYMLSLPPDCEHYADAQIDDYRSLPRSEFRWRPPLHLELNARASSSQPSGTLGFGLWNDPFSMILGQGAAEQRIPALPQAAWFFYGSPPNDLSLGGRSPGAGWLAMTMRSRRIPTPLIAPPLLLAWLLAQIQPLRAPLFKIARSIVRVEACEVGVPMDDWHRYAIEWLPEQIEFHVDGRLVMAASLTLRIPLGFVAWIDNQYLIASPAAGLRFGVLSTVAEQWLELKGLSIRKAI